MPDKIGVFAMSEIAIRTPADRPELADPLSQEIQRRVSCAESRSHESHVTIRPDCLTAKRASGPTRTGSQRPRRKTSNTYATEMRCEKPLLKCNFCMSCSFAQLPGSNLLLRRWYPISYARISHLSISVDEACKVSNYPQELPCKHIRSPQEPTGTTVATRTSSWTLGSDVCVIWHGTYAQQRANSFVATRSVEVSGLTLR